MMPRRLKRGFTLVEMLVVIGIIAILAGVVFVSMGRISKTAQRAKAQEAVSNAAVALSYIFQKNMSWPTLLSENAAGGVGRLDKTVARVFVAQGNTENGVLKPLLGVDYDKTKYGNSSEIELIGSDSCGIVTPWAQQVLKRQGTSSGTKVPTGGTVSDHVLYYAIDLDGDGITEAKVGESTLRIRASAACWCAGADGELGTYGVHSKKQSDDVYSWNRGQLQNN